MGSICQKKSTTKPILATRKNSINNRAVFDDIINHWLKTCEMGNWEKFISSIIFKYTSSASTKLCVTAYRSTVHRTHTHTKNKGSMAWSWDHHGDNVILLYGNRAGFSHDSKHSVACSDWIIPLPVHDKGSQDFFVAYAHRTMHCPHPEVDRTQPPVKFECKNTFPTHCAANLKKKGGYGKQFYGPYKCTLHTHIHINMRLSLKRLENCGRVTQNNAYGPQQVSIVQNVPSQQTHKNSTSKQQK